MLVTNSFKNSYWFIHLQELTIKYKTGGFKELKLIFLTWWLEVYD